MLEVKNLHVEVEGKQILNGIDLNVKPGEMHAIMGLNGSGKSTLSNAITGRENYSVTKGDIIYKNESIVEIKKEHNNLTWSGISIINPIIFRENSFQTKIFNMWDTVLPKYISTNKVTGHISSELWIDVGTPERLNLANRVYNDKKLDYE